MLDKSLVARSPLKIQTVFFSVHVFFWCISISVSWSTQYVKMPWSIQPIQWMYRWHCYYYLLQSEFKFGLKFDFQHGIALHTYMLFYGNWPFEHGLLSRPRNWNWHTTKYWNKIIKITANLSLNTFSIQTFM